MIRRDQSYFVEKFFTCDWCGSKYSSKDQIRRHLLEQLRMKSSLSEHRSPIVILNRHDMVIPATEMPVAQTMAQTVVEVS
jgi:hypothetical protein